jgi:hypothetical protein
MKAWNKFSPEDEKKFSAVEMMIPLQLEADRKMYELHVAHNEAKKRSVMENYFRNIAKDGIIIHDESLLNELKNFSPEVGKLHELLKDGIPVKDMYNIGFDPYEPNDPLAIRQKTKKSVPMTAPKFVKL